MKLWTSLVALATAFPSTAFAFTPLLRSIQTKARSSVASDSLSLRSSATDEEEYDLVVIGGGSGGVRCSRISAGYGKKVAILEPQLNHGAPNYSAIGGTVRITRVLFFIFVSCLLILIARFVALPFDLNVPSLLVNHYY